MTTENAKLIETSKPVLAIMTQQMAQPEIQGLFLTESDAMQQH